VDGEMMRSVSWRHSWVGGVAALALTGSSAHAEDPPKADPAVAKVEIFQVVQREPALLITAGFPEAPPAKEDVTLAIPELCVEAKSVSRLAEADLKYGTLFLVDTSGSMQAALPEVRTALETWIGGMSPKEVAIIASFGDTVEGVNGAWSGPEQRSVLLEATRTLKANGRSTHLFEALDLATNRLAKDESEIPLRTIVVLSDGHDEGSPQATTLDGAKLTAAKHDIQVNAVGFQLSDQDYGGTLRTLAEYTHGRYERASANRPQDIQKSFAGFQTSAHNLVLVTADTSEIPTGNYNLRLSVGGKDRFEGSKALQFERRFQGSLQDCDPGGSKKLTWIGGAVAGVLALAFLAWVLWSRRNAARERLRLEQKLSDSRRETMDTLADVRREAISAAAPRPRRVLLRGPDSLHPLFEADAFSVVIVGSDPSRAGLVLDHPTVSGRHASVERRAEDPEAIYVTDLGSSNGTYHQGLDIRGRGTIRVATMERLQFGLVALLVEMPGV